MGGRRVSMAEKRSTRNTEPTGQDDTNSERLAAVAEAATDGEVATAAPGPVRDGHAREPRTRHNLNREGVVMSLAAKGLTYSQISAHLAEVYGATISPEAVARITDGVIEEMTDWQTRPLEEVYPVLFIDAMVVKIRGGKVANRPVHTAIGVTLDGRREVLGLWISEAGEGARYWHQVLTEIANRGVHDVCFLICDGLKGLAEAANAVWPQAIVQTCVVHLLRNTFRYGSHNDQQKLARDVRPIYAAPNEAAARERLNEFAANWGDRYPAIVRLWESAWPDFVPFLEYSPDIREVIYTTNAIENLHSQLRRAVLAHNYFQTEEAALKCLYLAIRSFDPSGASQRRWSNRWKAALNAFALTFEGRISPGY
jgi:putative transposase